MLSDEERDLRSHLAESVAKECKCETNTAVNHDLVNSNIKMREFLIDCAESHHETRYKYRAKALLNELYPKLKG